MYGIIFNDPTLTVKMIVDWCLDMYTVNLEICCRIYLMWIQNQSLKIYQKWSGFIIYLNYIGLWGVIVVVIAQ